MKTYSLRFSNGKRSFDKYIGDDYYYALYYIKTNNGNDNEHFISYRGGTVSIIETNTNNVYYTEKIETMADKVVGVELIFFSTTRRDFNHGSSHGFKKIRKTSGPSEWG